MNLVPTLTDKRKLVRIFASINRGGDPLRPPWKAGRYIGTMDEVDAIKTLVHGPSPS